MSSVSLNSFNPYHKWLGIPQREQPPNHYRLLGIELFENDPQVVEGAADRQMAFLRKHQAGDHSADALKLLNEVSRARICLLKPETKTAYDAALKIELEAKVEKPVSNDQIDVFLVEPSPSDGSGRLKLPLLAGAGVAVAALLVAGFLFTRPAKPVPAPVDPGAKVAPVVAAATDKTNNNSPANPGTAVKSKSVDKTKTPANQDRPLAKGDKAPWTTLLDPDSPLATKSKTKSGKQNPTSPETINLLANLDVKRDQIQGSWRVENGQLCTPVGYLHATFHLRKSLPDEYDLLLNVTRRAGEDCFFLAFPVQGQQAGIVVDAWGGANSGIDMIDGLRSNARPDAHRGTVLPPSQKVEFEIQVRKGAISITADGTQIVNWKGDPSKLSIYEKYTGRDPASLFVGSYGADFAISRCDLIPVAGASTPSSTQKPAGEIDLLSRLDIDRDAADGEWVLASDGLVGRAPVASVPARLSIPYRPAAQYDLRMTVERQMPQGEFLIGLPVQGSQCMMVLDSGRNRDISGLSMIDGKLGTRNETTKRGNVLRGGEVIALTCKVRVGSITVLADDKVLVDWKGDAERLSAPNVIPFVDPQGLLLAVYGGGSFRINGLTISPANGSGSSGSDASTKPIVARTNDNNMGIEGSLEIPKLPTPDAAAQDSAGKKLREQFKVEYAQAKKAEGRNLEPKSNLARTLFARAQSLDDDPAACYVMLSDAAEFAAEAGQLGLAWEILVSLGDRFDVPSLPLMERAAKSATPFAKSPEEITMLGSMYVLLLEQAVRNDDFETAAKASQAATSVTRKIPVLKEQLAGIGRRITQLREAFESAKVARDALKANPDDGAANQTWGAYLCFNKGDWSTGLPLLAKSADADMAGLAKRDLDQPRDLQPLIQLGDDWWELADKHKEPLKTAIRERATDAWQLALSTSPSTQKTALETKIQRVFGTTKPFETTGSGGGVGVAGVELNPGPFFTVEFWVATDSDEGVLIAKRQDRRESSLVVSLDSGRPTIEGRGPNIFRRARTKIRIDDGRWHHIAVVKAGSRMGIFVDGKWGANIDYPDNLLSNSNWKVGQDGASTDDEPKAKFCRLRFSKEARYLVNFVPEKTYAKDKGTLFVP